MSRGVRDHFAAIGAQLDRLERSASAAERDRTRALVRRLLDAHRRALTRLLEMAGDEVASRLAEDAEIAALLMLHGLHPVPLRERVERCLAGLIPRLAARHADLALVALGDDGIVRLRLQHAGPRGSLQAEIDEALAAAAADAAGVEIDEQVVVAVQLGQLRGRVPR